MYGRSLRQIQTLGLFDIDSTNSFVESLEGVKYRGTEAIKELLTFCRWGLQTVLCSNFWVAGNCLYKHFSVVQ